MKKIYLVFIILLFTSCTSKVDIKKDDLQYPDWYLNVPKNNDISLYGVGIGQNNNQAVKNALEDLSSRLLVTISANTTTSSKSYRDFREYTQKTVVQDIKSQIEKLSFQNYIIEKSTYFDKSIIVLLSVQKSKVANDLKKEIDFLYKESESLKNQKMDTLSKYLKYKDLLDIFYKNYNKSQILSSFIDDNDKYIKTIDEIKNTKNILKNQIDFFINSDNNSRKFDNLFKNSLVNKGFKVVEASLKNENSYELNINSQSSQNRAYDFYIIENILNIKIINSKNSQILGKSIELKGASSNSFDDAKINLIQKLKNEQEKEDILPF
ncbi:LPP20 family lipoprotein [Aliarcobacter vitoriensis]|uniref:LPP20 family lipoprotein n=1 Tax=Aliarcobacter vitoriensis TaxID=2011099 RepID=UPI003AABB6C6